MTASVGDVFCRLFKLCSAIVLCVPFFLFSCTSCIRVQYDTQIHTVVSGFLGAILHLCPGFVQSSRRTSIVNQGSTQQQCGESGGSQVV